ncbi:MAG TPA: hypothetical protein PLX33_10390 [Alphaproteobacteria bacterium]|nr:hypothetical protein [Alphaproteobacteria bacterium]
MRLQIFAAFAFSLFLTGCFETPWIANDYDKVLSLTTATHDSYSDVHTVKGPSISLSNYTWFIRGFSQKNKNIGDLQIYVHANFSEWAFLNAAYSGGKSFKLTQISRDVGTCSKYGCTLHEHVGIDISPSQLKSYAKSKDGMALKVQGNAGFVTIFIPPEYFAAYLDFAKSSGYKI